ncbi:MAG: TIGR02206 family membrane protein [Paenisporosarcina sp.]|nr:TIGR02206 family membrane protein [Paenisporosarcina sp.]
MIWNEEPVFTMFSTSHFVAIIGLVILIVLLFAFRHKGPFEAVKMKVFERFFAVTLLGMDSFYYVWLYQTGRWDLSHSLPLELCSISLLATILLLWTCNKHLYEFVFYAGIGGAVQAIATPVLDMGYPHFRFFHFFYTHIGIIITALYFSWYKGYRPTFKGIVKTIIVLNILLLIVFTVNVFVDGNYMFLQRKPVNGSLLDFLGPYPWYIFTLELVAFALFFILWLLFRMKHPVK